MYDKSKSILVTVNNSIYEEKSEMSNEKLKMDNSEDLTHKEVDEIDEHLVFLSKRFSN